MEFIRGLYNLRPSHTNCAITIGKYDGIHLGHQAVIKKLVLQAKILAIKSIVIFFEPLPSEYYRNKPWFERITSLREKLAILQTLGVDYVLCMPFSKELAQTSAEAFVTGILIQKLAIRYILVGYDFTFGYQGQGTFAVLTKYAKQGFFQAESLAPYMVKGHIVSSSQIYTALKQGKITFANQLLGRPYTLYGRVVSGLGLGQQLGFPTINLYILHQSLPLYGVYVVQVTGLTTPPGYGVANVGFRPTVGNNQHKVFEVHLFDYNANAYGKKVMVQLLQKLRNEQQFSSLTKLQQQISSDVAQAKLFLTTHRFS